VQITFCKIIISFFIRLVLSSKQTLVSPPRVARPDPVSATVIPHKVLPTPCRRWSQLPEAREVARMAAAWLSSSTLSAVQELVIGILVASCSGYEASGAELP